MTEPSTEFRVNHIGDPSSPSVIWFVEYKWDGEWYDLFEDPPKAICETIAQALNQAKIQIMDLREADRKPFIDQGMG